MTNVEPAGRFFRKGREAEDLTDVWNNPYNHWHGCVDCNADGVWKLQYGNCLEVWFRCNECIAFTRTSNSMELYQATYFGVVQIQVIV